MFSVQQSLLTVRERRPGLILTVTENVMLGEVMSAEILYRDKCLKSLPVTQSVNSVELLFSVYLLWYRIKCFHPDFSLTVTHTK